MQLANLLASALLVVGPVSAAALSRRSSSGPKGVVTPYHQPEAFSRVTMASLNTMQAAADGSYTTCIPVNGGATVKDCKAVIEDIRSNNGTIQVAPGFCLNWWEDTCQAKVCVPDVDKIYSEKASVIADSMSADLLGVCIAKGESGVVADCFDFASPCGTYRYYLDLHEE